MDKFVKTKRMNVWPVIFVIISDVLGQRLRAQRAQSPLHPRLLPSLCLTVWKLWKGRANDSTTESGMHMHTVRHMMRFACIQPLLSGRGLYGECGAMLLRLLLYLFF